MILKDLIYTQNLELSSEYDVLESIYLSTGNSWVVQWHFLGDGSTNYCNDFEGVTCTEVVDIGERVTGLVLDNFNLYKFIQDSDLIGLPYLTTLSIEDNPYMTGTIPPAIGSLSSLQYLRLRNGELTGTIPTEIASLTSLKELDLSLNDINGTIPSEFGLMSLQTLNIIGASLSGTLPPELGLMTNIEVLDLEGNLLNGTIPTEFGNLQTLTYLDLEALDLTGALSSEIGFLTNLSTLQLNRNSLSKSMCIRYGSTYNSNIDFVTQGEVYLQN